MILSARTHVIGFCFSVCVVLPVAQRVAAEKMESDEVVLISPRPGQEVIAKNPLISLSSKKALLEDGGIVLLDGNDITQLLVKKENIYSFIPPEPLTAGQHTLYIITFDDSGGELTREFAFSSRQSESFEEIYSNNYLSATQKAVVSRDFSESEDSHLTPIEEFPYASFDSYLTSESVVKEGGLHSSARANLRYYDQNASLLEPEKKGLSVMDFLVSAKYVDQNYTAMMELGDTTIEESKNTIGYLTRRGGRVSVTSGWFTMGGFSVMGKESGYEIDGVGMRFNSNDHIMGASMSADLYKDQLSIKTIYVTGGEEGDYIGTWSEADNIKGDVYGLLITSDFFDELFITEFELDSANYDSDTGDDFSGVDDDAYRFRVSGLKEPYDWEASYSYTGPEYQVVGNQDIIKDWAGYDLQGTVTYPEHILRLFGNYSWDNVEGDELFARIYSLTGGAEYSFLKWQCFPFRFLAEYNTQESSDEPDGVDGTSLDTYQVTGEVSYMAGSWNVGVKTTYSEQNDNSDNDADIELFTFEFTPSYTQGLFLFLPSWTYNSSRDFYSDVRTTTNTLTLDIYSSFFADTITGEFGGTYDWIEADNDSVDTRNSDLYAKLSYRMKNLGYFEDSSIALEYHYKRQDDEIYDALYRENSVTLVFSTALPYSF